jgi:hypothetical protein
LEAREKMQDTKEMKKNPIWVVKLNSILNKKEEAKNASQVYKANANGKRND